MAGEEFFGDVVEQLLGVALLSLWYHLDRLLLRRGVVWGRACWGVGPFSCASPDGLSECGFLLSTLAPELFQLGVLELRRTCSY